jgi:hypothetical protein
MAEFDKVPIPFWRNRMLTLLFAVSAAYAAPADWTNYLCKYGDDQTTQLVKVNEKDGRVTINDHDMNRVQISATEISFSPPRGGVWVIKKPALKLETLRYIPPGIAKMEDGTCKIVSD